MKPTIPLAGWAKGARATTRVGKILRAPVPTVTGRCERFCPPYSKRRSPIPLGDPVRNLQAPAALGNGPEQPSAFATAHCSSRRPRTVAAGVFHFVNPSNLVAGLKRIISGAQSGDIPASGKRAFSALTTKRAAPLSRISACLLNVRACGRLHRQEFRIFRCQECSHAQNGQNLRANGPDLPMNSFGSASIPMNMKWPVNRHLVVTWAI